MFEFKLKCRYNISFLSKRIAMTSQLELSSYDDLEIAYQIGRFIQSHVNDKHENQKGRPFSDYSALFNHGPRPFFNQTKKGLVLEGYYGIPSQIHTPYGCWSILGNGYGTPEEWGKVFEAIKEPLGLVPLQESFSCDEEPRWAITKWKDKEIEQPEYKKPDERFSRAKVRLVWEAFITLHPELII